MSKPALVKSMLEATKVRGKDGESYPHFTKDFFSTKSFGPGHIVGLGVLVFGTIAMTRAFIARGNAQARERELAARRMIDPSRTAENARGQYGKSTP